MTEDETTQGDTAEVADTEDTATEGDAAATEGEGATEQTEKGYSLDAKPLATKPWSATDTAETPGHSSTDAAASPKNIKGW